MAPNTQSEVAGPGDDYDETGQNHSEVKEILYEGYYYDVTNFVSKHG